MTKTIWEKYSPVNPGIFSFENFSPSLTTIVYRCMAVHVTKKPVYLGFFSFISSISALIIYCTTNVNVILTLLPNYFQQLFFSVPMKTRFLVERLATGRAWYSDFCVLSTIVFFHAPHFFKRKLLVGISAVDSIW